MKKKIITIAAAAFFMLALVPLAHAVEKGMAGDMATEKAEPAKKPASMKQETMTVTGTIVANKNKQGKIIGYALQEDGGQSVMLSKHGKGRELRKMVGSKVEATGTVKKSKAGKMITVKTFKKI